MVLYWPIFTWNTHLVPDSCRLANCDQLFFRLPAESVRPLLLPKLLLPPLFMFEKGTGSKILSNEDDSSPERSCKFVAGLDVESSNIESSIRSLRCWVSCHSDGFAFQGRVSLLPAWDVFPHAKNILAPSLLHFRCPGINFFWLGLSAPPPAGGK